MKSMHTTFVSTVIALLLAFGIAQDGAELYSNNCAQCHGAEGQGGIGPALVGNSELSETALVVNQILHGGGGMPAFADQLNTEQVAAVASYIRTAWGNSFGEVTVDTVAQIAGEQGEQHEQQEDEAAQPSQAEQTQEQEQAQEGEQAQSVSSPELAGVPATEDQVATAANAATLTDTEFELVEVAGGFADPVSMESADDGSGRLFVVERLGRVQIVQDGMVLDTPFMDISGEVTANFLEQGLYDIAFHPDFEENGRLFAHFSELMRNGDSMIVEYSVSEDDPNRVDPDSARVILQIDQPFANHNGGELAFGPDGYLYIGSGDGGWEGDPLGAGQDLATLLGKILRIDVDVPQHPYRRYGIPEDNPFATKEGLVRLFGLSEDFFAQLHTQARPEIFAYGLRNPYTFSFDPASGDMYIAEVGQNHWEEVDLLPAGAKGLNYGWDFKMGTHCFPIGQESCADVGVLPIAEYSHEGGNCSVIDVGVARNGIYPGLDGAYLFADYCSGRIWATSRDSATQDDDTPGTAWRMQELLDAQLLITGSGVDDRGNLYVTSCECTYGGGTPSANQPGSLWRLVPADEVPDDATRAPKDESSQNGG